MPLRFLIIQLRRFFDVRAEEIRHVGFMAALLFFLLAANNVIKVIRDALFLSHFPITDLPKVYLLAAFVAGIVIAVYSRYAAKLSLDRVLRGSLAFTIVNAILFWLLLVFFNAGWLLYAYYIWSAMVGLILIAQFWTFANEMFTPRDGKRLFGMIAAGGTLGGMAGGILANWAVRFLFATNQLLWLVAALLAGAYGVAALALRAQDVRSTVDHDQRPTEEIAAGSIGGAFGTLRGSYYLQTIGGVIFLSVVVSTLIDYQFKAAAKEAFLSADALAGFFSSYYVWLSVVTLIAQLWLTGKVLTNWGITASLVILPIALLGGSMALLLWPGLFVASATRMTEASLRTSVNQSGIQILYLPVPDAVKKKVKVFMDVTVERVGDATAAVLILFLSLVLGQAEVTQLSYFSVAIILLWITMVLTARSGYIDSLRKGLAYREVSLETAGVDFTDKATAELVLMNLDGKNEESIHFGLDLAKRFDPKLVAARLPRGLLHHPSPEVRRRALALIAASLDANVLAVIFELLATENAQVRSEAISTLAAMLKDATIPVMRPFLKSPDIQTRNVAIRLMLQSGDPQTRRDALADFQQLLADSGPAGAESRIEAARLMGDIGDPEFAAPLGRLIREDASPAVIREAMAAAARGKYARAIPEIMSRLSSSSMNIVARESLVQFGDVAAKELRNALFDSRVPRDVRLNIPHTLNKIHSQLAMTALQGGLLDEDRSIRFKVILAIQEMARRFPDLDVDRQIVESAIMSDTLLYSRRFVTFSALFGSMEMSSPHGQSLLYFALIDSMERVKERVMWLLSLLYSAKDIRGTWSALNSHDRVQRARATELLENLLSGDIKIYVFPLYSDSPPEQRLRMALDSLGTHALDTDSALRMLLAQEDRWLKVATVWEIGVRKLIGFRDIVSELAGSEDAVLRETAIRVLQGDKVS